MKRILITGITGFIGTNLVKYLESKNTCKVFGHSRNTKKAKLLFDNVDFIPSLSAVSLDRYMIDTVIHLAGIAHDLSGKYTKEDYLNVNCNWTAEIFDYVQNSNVNSFIYLSSIKALTDASDRVIDEALVSNPQSDYGISKRMSEDYIFANRTQRKKTYILRPCMVHGPGNKGNLNMLYKFVKSGMPYPLAAFDNKRSFLSIDNFCFVIEHILKDSLPSGEYLLADSDAISTRELVQLIADESNKKLFQLKLPKALIKAIARMGSLFKTSFNTTSLSKLVENLEVSNQKLLDNLGVELPVSTTDGLKKTIRSFNE